MAADTRGSTAVHPVVMTTMAATAAFALTQPSISGDYLEVRSCDIYTGPCFANAEMGLTGKETIMVWSVKQGSWEGASLDGLSVIAVLRTDATLGNVKYEPRSGKAVLIVDEKANPAGLALETTVLTVDRAFKAWPVDEVRFWSVGVRADGLRNNPTMVTEEKSPAPDVVRPPGLEDASHFVIQRDRWERFGAKFVRRLSMKPKDA